jgi:sugar lactone lactonase YvrE
MASYTSDVGRRSNLRPACSGRRTVALILAGVAGLAVVLGVLAARSPIDPVAWTPPEPPALSGPLEPNESLREVTLLGGDLAGPEDVDVDALGRIYCGVEDGSVLRLDPRSGSGRFEIFVSTGGRPLGLDFDASGTLWVADTRLGLVSVDPQKHVAVRSTEAEGVPVVFADDVAVAADGKVYFSDASTRFGHDRVMLDALEARAHGRLLEYDPATDRTRVVLDGLYFANGVAVAPDDSFVLVAETFRYRIRRVWLRGPHAGRHEILIDNLPGFPDGVAGDGAGLFWVAFYAPRNALLDRYLHPRPWLKRLVASLPRALNSRAEPYGLVIAIDSNGRIARSLHDPGGRTLSHITSVEPHGPELYLGTVEGRVIGRYSIP